MKTFILAFAALAFVASTSTAYANCGKPRNQCSASQLDGTNNVHTKAHSGKSPGKRS